ncbi:MAG: hypothetical protein KGJ87_08840 [Planctomycetota bacterium]|nr:hypothetical protein [Planctomycetota bacterium]MDE2217247.1 hypothetical protein [Planctomycetota bacterium]
MAYVTLVSDYKSPFRKRKLEDKKYLAAMAAGYKLEKDGKRPDINTRNLMAGKVGNVIAAIKKYNEIQYDEDFETLLSVKTLISDIRKFNDKKDKTILELEKAVVLTTGKLDKLVSTKKALEDILDLRDEPPTTPDGVSPIEGDDIVDEGSLSILEKVNQGII